MSGASFWVSASIMAAFIQFFIQVLIGRVYGAEALGIYAWIQSLIIPLSFLIWMSARPRYILDLLTEKEFYLVARARWLTDPFVYVCFSAVLFCFLFMYKENTSDVFFVIAFLSIGLKYVEGLFDLLMAYAQKYNEIRRLFFITLIRVVALLLLGACVIIYELPYLLLLTFLIYIPIAFYETRRVYPAYVKYADNTGGALQGYYELIVSGSLYGAISLLIATISVFPRIALEFSYDVQQLGYFFAGFQFVLIGGVVVTSIGSYLSRVFKEHLDKGEFRLFYFLFFKIVLIFSILWVLGLQILIPIEGWVLDALYGAGFYQESGSVLLDAYYVTPFVYIATIAGVMVFVFGQPKLITSIYMAITLLSVVLSTLCLSVIGVKGVYWAISVTYSAQILFFIIASLLLWVRK